MTVGLVQPDCRLSQLFGRHALNRQLLSILIPKRSFILWGFIQPNQRLTRFKADNSLLRFGRRGIVRKIKYETVVDVPEQHLDRATRCKRLDVEKRNNSRMDHLHVKPPVYWWDRERSSWNNGTPLCLFVCNESYADF